MTKKRKSDLMIRVLEFCLDGHDTIGARWSLVKISTIRFGHVMLDDVMRFDMQWLQNSSCRIPYGKSKCIL